MICPKCGFEQPDNPECMRCGVIISRYKGPVLGSAAPGLSAPPAPVSPRGVEPVRSAVAPPPRSVDAAPTLYRGPEPALAAAGGTVYDGPAPAEAGGGTMYTGTMFDGAAPRVPGSKVKTAFHAKFDNGKILSEAFAIYFSNLLPFLLLTAVALSPMLITLAMVSGSAETQDAGLMLASILLLALSFVLCPQLATASITYGVFQQMRGRDATIGDCLGKGLSSLFSVLWLVIVQTLGILLGLVLFIVPGIILALRWAVSVPAAVEERGGALEALKRSAYLTDGHKGAIFGVLFVLNFLSSGIDRISKLAFADSPSALMMVTAVGTVVTVGLTATATAVMYYRLRSIKESIDVDQIASVFA